MVMSEFLVRGWNVAIPEVDIGDDIFVVQDDNGTLRRVQVKTSSCTFRQNSFSGQFKIPIWQLKKIADVLVHFIFIVRINETWTKPLIIRQDFLLSYFTDYKLGSEHHGNLNLYFKYTQNKVECSGLDFTKYTSNFTDFPIIIN